MTWLTSEQVYRRVRVSEAVQCRTLSSKRLHVHHKHAGLTNNATRAAAKPLLKTPCGCTSSLSQEFVLLKQGDINMPVGYSNGLADLLAGLW